jgi:hypothetical protein
MNDRSAESMNVLDAASSGSGAALYLSLAAGRCRFDPWHMLLSN